jgi:signal transduction histidine kinase/ActR/RegA family two-component response regulator
MRLSASSLARLLSSARMPGMRTLRILLALAIVATATLLRLSLEPILRGQVPFFVYVGSVVVASWFAGVAGGLVATAMATLMGNYFFVAPRFALKFRHEDLAAMITFAAFSLGLVWLVSRWRSAEQQLNATVERLQEQAGALTLASRIKDEFLSTLSHELRTPLNAILGWSDLVMRPGFPDDARGRALEAINRNARAQSALIDDILDVSRIVSGKIRLDLQEVELTQLVTAACDSIQPAAAGRGVDVQVDVGLETVLVADQSRLQQILWNLLSNSVKFNDRGGRVRVEARVEGADVRIRVSDTGAGIPADVLPHVFERFRQADASTTRRHGGLGLGLAIVKHLVELHGGTVRAESDGEGRGAAFTVTLPRRVAAGTGSQREWRSAAAGGPSGESSAGCLDGVRVVAVDDAAEARMLIEAILRPRGARVTMCASAEEAMIALSQEPADVLVADIAMPSVDGHELMRRVRAASSVEVRSVAGLALSAYASAEDRERALAAGYREHLAKPVSPDALVAAVARLAGRQPGPSDARAGADARRDG